MKRYKHFKGEEYIYVCGATHTDHVDTEHGDLIVYHDLDGKAWVRPRSEFFGYIEVPTPDGFGNVRRFKEMRCSECGEWVDECRAGHKQED